MFQIETSELIQALVGIVVAVIALLRVQDRGERIGWFAAVIGMTALVVALL